jgi:AcrR family transcriptional regulator
MADQKLDTQIRREQIAEAALSLIATQGLGRLSVAAVARRVGLVPSGIYRHFGSKDQIIDAVLDLLERRMGEIIQAAQQASPDPVERLRTVLMGHIRFIRQGRAIPRIVFSEEMHAGQPHRKARVHGIVTRYLDDIARFVEQGQHDGRLRAEVAPQTVALMLIGIVVPAGVLWHLTDGGFDVTKHAERAWRIFSEAIVTPRER